MSRVSASNNRGRAEPTKEFASAQTTTCSDGDSFYLDADRTYDGLSTFDGCYSDSGFVQSGFTAYFRDGEKAEGPAVVASDDFGVTVSCKTHYWQYPFSIVPATIFDGLINDVRLDPLTMLLEEARENTTDSLSQRTGLKY